jgi:argininosuccinate synthase
MAKVVLAYSGGLATSICLHTLRMKKGHEVITYSANLGQDEYLEPLGEKAIELGAKAAHIGDLREKFLRDYAFNALKADAVFHSGYLLTTALARPAIVSEMVKIAQEEGCEYLAHGCTGKGNDQVRFEVCTAALAPHLKILAPLAECGITSTKDQYAYGAKYDLPFQEDDRRSTYCIDHNLWGLAIGCEPAENPWEEVPEEIFSITVSPEKAPDEPVEVTIGFEKGEPVRLDGEPLSPVELIARLNVLGGENGIGRMDVLEDRIVGIKTREIYEAPAATILYQAHRALEFLVLSKEVLNFKKGMSIKYADLIYHGLWFSELRKALSIFFDEVQKYVCGDVRLRLYKGNTNVLGVRSRYSLYDRRLATYAEKDIFDHAAARGFLDIYSLAMKTEAMHWRQESR